MCVIKYSIKKTYSAQISSQLLENLIHKYF